MKGLSLGLMAMLTLVVLPARSASAANSHGQSPGDPAYRVLTIPQVYRLCARGSAARSSVRVSGYSIFLFHPGPPGYQGALFPSSVVPTNSVEGGRWRRFGGLGVIMLHPPFQVYWVTLTGTIRCDRSGPFLEATDWRRAAPEHSHDPTVRPVSGVLTPQAALTLCRSHPQATYRVTVGGRFYEITMNLLPNEGFLAGGLLVSGAASHYTTEIAQRIPVDVSGLLACHAGPPELEVYSWRRA